MTNVVHILKAIDKELEKRNFQHAGESFAEIWRESIIDGHSVFAEYVTPSCDEKTAPPLLPDAKWYEEHVKESQYFLQITKCFNKQCCSPARSSLRTVVFPVVFSVIPN